YYVKLRASLCCPPVAAAINNPELQPYQLELPQRTILPTPRLPHAKLQSRTTLNRVLWQNVWYAIGSAIGLEMYELFGIF
ncbi:hypothetical protein, partial [Pseudomonas syringae]|uniref:hypothetical protein n=1 Tax=Pseudomonas syringae TaxID=317 RepID=UPI001F0F91D4